MDATLFFSSGLRPIAAQKVNVSTICFLVGNDHCTENCCRCANFFFRRSSSSSSSFSEQHQQPFVAVALMAVSIGSNRGPTDRRASFFYYTAYRLQQLLQKPNFAKQNSIANPFFAKDVRLMLLQRRTNCAALQILHHQRTNSYFIGVCTVAGRVGTAEDTLLGIEIFPVRNNHIDLQIQSAL